MPFQIKFIKISFFFFFNLFSFLYKIQFLKLNLRVNLEKTILFPHCFLEQMSDTERIKKKNSQCNKILFSFECFLSKINFSGSFNKLEFLYPFFFFHLNFRICNRCQLYAFHSSKVHTGWRD